MTNRLYKLIQEGEHIQQDFKYCVNDSKKIAKSLVAFANTQGGRLLLGVKDNGRIAGVQSEEEFYMIESAAAIYCKPAVSFSIKQWHVEGKTVLEVNVEPSNNKPHFAKDENAKWIAFVRIDDENCVAPKILLNVWRNQKKPVHLTLSEDEKLLISFLQQSESVSLSKFTRIAHISRFKAEEVLTNFALLGIIQIFVTKTGTVFKINPDYLQN